jgi:hypothetical protein
MMRSFFQSLETESVRYLLISGQATVLYGAAMFSEDIDLWIEPSKANIAALMNALAPEPSFTSSHRLWISAISSWARLPLSDPLRGHRDLQEPNAARFSSKPIGGSFQWRQSSTSWR